MSIDSPLKLDTTYNPVALWNFDGNLNDEGSAGETLTVARGSTTYATGHAHATKGFLFRDANTGIDGTTDPAPASLRITGDLTAQVVMRWAEFGIGAFGSELVSCKGDTLSEAENLLYSIDLQDIAGVMSPQFQWEHGAGSTRVTVSAPSTYTLTPHRWYHIVCRRTDAGSGNSFGELFVNGKLLASATHPNATGGTLSLIQIGKDQQLNVDLKKSTISSIKINDTALTDAQLAAEFERIAEAIR